MYNCFNAFSSGKSLSECLGFASGRVNSGGASAIPSCIKVIFACGAITKPNIAALSSLGYCWLCFAMRTVTAIKIGCKNWYESLAAIFFDNLPTNNALLDMKMRVYSPLE